MPTSRRNYRVHNYLFLNDEFVEMAETIMENTFFNIIQETTRKENDMLREAKRFLSISQP